MEIKIDGVTYNTIEKESIANLHFPKEDVLNDAEDLKLRRTELDRALLLGNVDHGKIKIFFEDDTLKRVVETTVWGLTDNSVILKQGTVIPIHRIYFSQ